MLYIRVKSFINSKQRQMKINVDNNIIYIINLLCFLNWQYVYRMIVFFFFVQLSAAEMSSIFLFSTSANNFMENISYIYKHIGILFFNCIICMNIYLNIQREHKCKIFYVKTFIISKKKKYQIITQIINAKMF